jgi:L-ribulose-5-phosphate 4-epimerase
VAVSLQTGEVLQGDLRPSSDTPTHVEIYRAFPLCGGVVHTHSEYATSCAQARMPIRCMGTTHADYFHGDIPLTRPLTQDETSGAYEKNTGLVIAETFQSMNPVEIQAVLVANHGPFVWGSTPDDAVHNAVIVEYLARMQVHGCSLNPNAPSAPQFLIDKHYNRKHGAGAYYGQTKPA